MSYLLTNPNERDKCFLKIVFLQKNKKIICKARMSCGLISCPSHAGKDDSPLALQPEGLILEKILI
jgi:hypothetical protein